MGRIDSLTRMSASDKIFYRNWVEKLPTSDKHIYKNKLQNEKEEKQN